jgi:hypothetical protein
MFGGSSPGQRRNGAARPLSPKQKAPGGTPGPDHEQQTKRGLVTENNGTGPDPRPVDHRYSLPNDVAQRSSESAELSVIAGLGFEGEK